MRHVHKPLRDQMPNLSLALPCPIHHKQRCSEGFLPLLPKQAWPDDDIDIACLVFQRDEQHSAVRKPAVRRHVAPRAVKVDAQPKPNGLAQ